MITRKDMLAFGNSSQCEELAFLNVGVFSFLEASVSEKSVRPWNQLINTCFPSYQKIWNKTLLRNSLSWCKQDCWHDRVKSWRFFLVLCRMDLFPKEKHLCHTPKNYPQFFTSLGLHFPMLANCYLGECYCAFCLPSTHRQLEFKINPVKFQE